MTKGINGWTFPAGTSWAEAARQARSAGFEVLEPILAADGELSPGTDEAACRAVGDQIRRAGVAVGALVPAFYWQVPLTSPDPQIRGQSFELTLAALDRANWLGAPVLLIVPGVVGRWNAKTPAARYEEALFHAYEALRRLAFEGERRNVTLAVENVWNRFLLSPVEMRDFIDRVGSPWVRVYFDVGNVLAFGYPQDWIDALGPRIVRVHARDYRLEGGTPQGFCLPGDGDVDWPEVFAALARSGYDGPITFEGRGDLAEISSRLDRLLGRA
ncbi:MAG: sugar phosphate isomerase/epimerase [Phycisphaerae bacterium]|jgi:hexulose-6-phosphate isomerase